MMSPKNNGVTDSRNRVLVMCRFRPQIHYEVEKGGSICVKFWDDTTIIMKNKRDTLFTFDRVMDCSTTQKEVFDYVGQPVVEDVLKGYNATIFAYGQTSAGKTYTMMNLPKKDQIQQGVDQRGLGPRLIDELFDAIDRSDDDLEFTVKVSFFEIYMERVHDLLDSSKTNLQVKEEKGGRGFFVADLTEVYVASDEEVYRILKLGNANKKISSTNMNSDSSRSHSILSMTITQRNVITSQTISSKLYIVDLAGSEKVYKTAASGLRLEEAKSINQSLATLGKVINALTDKNSVHIPYRESKLTKLLQDALGGNSRTTLLINCSPSNYNEEETLSTLRFGLSAKSIRNKPKVNLEQSPDEIRRRLKESLALIEELEFQNATMETELSMLRQNLTSKKLIIPENTANDQGEELTPYDLQCILKLHRLLEMDGIPDVSAKKYLVEMGYRILQFANHMRIEQEKLRDDHLALVTLQKELFDKVLVAFSALQHAQASEVPQKPSVTETSHKENAEDYTENEMREYIALLENENRTLRDDLDAYKKTNSALVQEEVLYLKKLANNTANLSLNTSTASTGSRNKVIVPLKPGFKKLKTLVNETDVTVDEDDEIDESTTSVLKCGYVDIMYFTMQGSERKVAWKNRWLVLPNMSTTIKCYKQLKSLKALEIPITDCEIEENTVIEDDPERSPCFSIKTREQKKFVVKVPNEEERQEWISYLKMVMKRLKNAQTLVELDI